MIVSRHIIEDVASLCDRLGVLASGRLLFIGTPHELVAPLKMRLWSTELEPGDGLVLSSRLMGRRRHYRVLAETPPASASRVEPTLEDGYLAMLKADHPC